LLDVKKKKDSVIDLGKMIQELWLSVQIKVISMVSPSDASFAVKELSFAALGMPELTLTLPTDGMLMLPTKHG
jgi:hypothetical protein